MRGLHCVLRYYSTFVKFKLTVRGFVECNFLDFVRRLVVFFFDAMCCSCPSILAPGPSCFCDGICTRRAIFGEAGPGADISLRFIRLT